MWVSNSEVSTFYKMSFATKKSNFSSTNGMTENGTYLTLIRICFASCFKYNFASKFLIGLSSSLTILLYLLMSLLTCSSISSGTTVI